MNFEDVDRSLPNGFHDAVLDKLEVDYFEDTAIFHMHVCIDEDDGKTEYKPGKVILTGLQFLNIEPPDNRYDFIEKELYVDFGSLEGLRKERIDNLPLDQIHKDAFVNWFFVSAWNSFIIFSAMNAEFVWKNGSVEG